jgi:hypothetical protein
MKTAFRSRGGRLCSSQLTRQALATERVDRIIFAAISALQDTENDSSTKA